MIRSTIPFPALSCTTECFVLVGKRALKLLLAEDDPMIGCAVEQGLRNVGYTVDWVRDGNAAELALFTGTYALLVLDLGLSRQDGLTLLKKIRGAGNGMPVLIVTARGTVSDRVTGLNLGADDYLTKPFDLDELVARIRALIRRHAGRARPEMRLGALSLDPQSREVRLNQEVLDLSLREFALLEALLETPGTVLSTEQLEDRLYGWGEEVASNAIEVHVHRLRKKLGVAWIKNVRGVGYRLVEPA